MKVIEDRSRYNRAESAFKKHFPRTAQNYDLKSSENLFSYFTLELDQKVLTQVQSLVDQFYKIKKTPLYYEQVLNPELIPLLENNYLDSVLCSFDFHYQASSEKLKLIEINTNASAYLVGSLVCDEQSRLTATEELVGSFKAGNLLDTDRLYIMDENPPEQKMYLEFLMYQELLSAHHKKDVTIMDSKELDQKINDTAGTKFISIYNRDTDFYLDHLPAIKQAYKERKLILSPHPVDYDLMAKKTNLDILKKIDLAHTNLFLKSGLIQSDFSSLQDLTAQKKNFYFKPSNSFGGKSVYRGANISNKYLSMAWETNMFYQEAFPADTFKDSQEQSWKYDLRFYTYAGLVQFVLARVYQGQITNFQTLGGGLAPVVFI